MVATMCQVPGCMPAVSSSRTRQKRRASPSAGVDCERNVTSLLARFHEPRAAGISEADGMAGFHNHPSLRDCEHDCLSGHPVQLHHHVPFMRLAARRVVRGGQQVQGLTGTGQAQDG